MNGKRFVTPGDALSPAFSFRVTTPTPDELRKVDEAWPPSRPEYIRHWLWTRIAGEAHETVRMEDQTGETATLFATYKSRLLRLHGSGLYCVDYLEVAPALRGGSWGDALLAAAAWRARECGGSGLAIPAVRELEGYYTDRGAERLRRGEWKQPAGVVAMKLVGEPFDDLLEALDELA